MDEPESNETDAIPAGELDAAVLEVDDQASALVENGRRLRQQGSLEAAQRAFEEAVALLQDPRLRGSRALALGELARLLAQTGEVASALALHQEALAVHEALAD